jgi:hypothetical protein
MRVMAIVLIAIAAAWMWWWPARLTADEEQTISSGLKNITSSMQKRSCIVRRMTMRDARRPDTQVLAAQLTVLFTSA